MIINEDTPIRNFIKKASDRLKYFSGKSDSRYDFRDTPTQNELSNNPLGKLVSKSNDELTKDFKDAIDRSAKIDRDSGVLRYTFSATRVPKEVADKVKPGGEFYDMVKDYKDKTVTMEVPLNGSKALDRRNKKAEKKNKKAQKNMNNNPQSNDNSNESMMTPVQVPEDERSLQCDENGNLILKEAEEWDDRIDNEDEDSGDVPFYKYIRTKSVLDSDGFWTDYTMYYDLRNDQYVFIFGDNDIYNPTNTEPDWEEEDFDAAMEWFDSYNGFEDDEDLDLDWHDELSDTDEDQDSDYKIDITDDDWERGKVESLELKETPGLKLSSPKVTYKDQDDYEGRLEIEINGKKYMYRCNMGTDATAREMADKVAKMQKFSDGKALAYLKKNMHLVTESVKVGDKVKVDTNFRGVNPKVKEVEITKVESGLATKDDPNPPKVLTVKGKDGAEFKVDENQIVKESARTEARRPSVADKTARELENKLESKFYDIAINDPEWAYGDQDMVDEYMMPRIEVQVDPEDRGRLIATVAAEYSGYDAQYSMDDELNKVIRMYDTGSYFEQVEPGISEAIVYVDGRAGKSVITGPLRGQDYAYEGLQLKTEVYSDGTSSGDDEYVLSLLKDPRINNLFGLVYDKRIDSDRGRKILTIRVAKDVDNSEYFSKLEDAVRKVFYTDEVWWEANDLLIDVTDWYEDEVSEGLQLKTEAHYGGAFDVADDQYFTRDDLDMFAEELLDNLKIFTSGDIDFDIGDIDIQNGNELFVEVDAEGNSFFGKVKIDMRKIKTPASLTVKYVPEILIQIMKQIDKYNKEGFAEITLSDTARKMIGESLELTTEAWGEEPECVQKVRTIAQNILVYVNSKHFRSARYAADQLINQIDKCSELLTESLGMNPSDGWSEEVSDVVSEVLNDCSDLQYEIDSAYRGYVSHAHTVEELADYIDGLAMRLSSAAEDLDSQADELNEEVKTEKVSFKDAYICKGCGKPLSQCTCGIKEEELKESVVTPGAEFTSKSGHKIKILDVEPFVSDYDGNASLRIKYEYELTDGTKGSSECNNWDLFHMLNEELKEDATQVSNVGQHKPSSIDLIEDEKEEEKE